MMHSDEIGYSHILKKPHQEVLQAFSTSFQCIVITIFFFLVLVLHVCYFKMSCYITDVQYIMFSLYNPWSNFMTPPYQDSLTTA